jgi:hypothetical protein
MAASPRFIASPFAANLTLNNASTDIDGGGSYDVVATATTNGARFDGCIVYPLDPCSETRINFFRNNAAGTKFIGSLIIPISNPNDIQGPIGHPFYPKGGPIILIDTDTIEAAIHASSSTVEFSVQPLGGNY